jgi:hypothetical protein
VEGGRNDSNKYAHMNKKTKPNQSKLTQFSQENNVLDAPVLRPMFFFRELHVFLHLS